MKIIKKVFVVIISIILILLMAFNIYNFYCVRILKQDLAIFHGYAILEVVSGSMEPTIHVGDMIVIDTKTTDYNKGDIVTFYDVNGSFVTHRIKSIAGRDMITRGDANDSDDEMMKTDRLVGKYVFKLNGIGRIISSFKSPFVMGMILVIGILACIFISTDKDGNPILEEDEKEFQEFQKYKENQENLEKENKKEKKIAALEKKSSKGKR